MADLDARAQRTFDENDPQENTVSDRSWFDAVQDVWSENSTEVIIGGAAAVGIAVVGWRVARGRPFFSGAQGEAQGLSSELSAIKTVDELVPPNSLKSNTLSGPLNVVEDAGETVTLGETQTNGLSQILTTKPLDEIVTLGDNSSPTLGHLDQPYLTNITPASEVSGSLPLPSLIRPRADALEPTLTFPTNIQELAQGLHVRAQSWINLSGSNSPPLAAFLVECMGEPIHP